MPHGAFRQTVLFVASWKIIIATCAFCLPFEILVFSFRARSWRVIITKTVIAGAQTLRIRNCFILKLAFRTGWQNVAPVFEYAPIPHATGGNDGDACVAHDIFHKRYLRLQLIETSTAGDALRLPIEPLVFPNGTHHLLRSRYRIAVAPFWHSRHNVLPDMFVKYRWTSYAFNLLFFKLKKTMRTVFHQKTKFALIVLGQNLPTSHL